MKKSSTINLKTDNMPVETEGTRKGVGVLVSQGVGVKP